MKRLSLVRNQDGRAVIYWPGVILSTAVFSAIYSAGVVILSLALEWFSIASFIGLPILLMSVVGLGIQRGLQLPPSELPNGG